LGEKNKQQRRNDNGNSYDNCNSNSNECAKHINPPVSGKYHFSGDLRHAVMAMNVRPGFNNSDRYSTASTNKRTRLWLRVLRYWVLRDG